MMHRFRKMLPIRQKMMIVVAAMVGLTGLATVGAAVGGAVGIGMGVVATIAAGVLGMMFRSAICDPYVTTVVRMEGLAAGDLHSPINFTDYQDCVGRLARAMFSFRDTAVAVQAGSTERQELNDLLGERLALLSQGHLNCDINRGVPEGYEILKTNFNAALENLRAMVRSVSESAEGIRTGSSEIAQASEDLARRTESNAASLQQTAASLSQIDERLKASSQSANRTVTRADDAIRSVGSGRAVAGEAVQAMNRVADSAKGIDNVIEGLDKIAFQTRVLAMNAAVEAGRAGEAGKGFAVVADLVSALAMRSEAEAQSAREQLTTTQTDIVSAVDAVTRVDGALADINAGVSEVHDLLASMATDNQAQSAAVSEINSAISGMDQSTQQNAAMVEQTSAAARNLLSEVRTLTSSAGRFEIGREHPNPGRRKPRANPPAAAPAQPAAVPTGYVSPVPALPVNGRGGSRGGDDWTDF